MVTIQVPGWGLGLGSLSTVGAEVLVGVWPDQQQAGLDTQQRFTSHLLAPLALEVLLFLLFLLFHQSLRICESHPAAATLD